MQRLRDQSGAVAIVVALVTCFVMLPLAAVAVDIGSQRVLRGDMQSLADVVALDAVRQVDGRTQAVIKATSQWRGVVAESVGDNLNLVLNQPGVHTVSVTQQQADAVATVANSDLVVTVTMGIVDATGTFTAPIPYPDTPNAVRVVAQSSLKHTFTGGSGGATRTAVATTSGNSCYRAGSFAFGLATNKSILAPILGDAAAGRVLSYNGIATASVSLLGLASAPQINVGTPDKLLGAPNITVANLIDASAGLLQQDGTTASANVAAQLLNLKTDLGPLANDAVDFGKLLNLGQGDSSALDANVDVLDLITGGLIAANGVNSVAVPGLDVTALGTTLHAALSITQPPKIGCNGGEATTAQGTVSLTGQISLVGLATLKNVSLTVSLANATAALDDSVSCSNDAIQVKVYNQTLANVRLTADVYALLGLVKLATIDTGNPTSTATKSYALPVPGSYTTPVTTDSGTLGLNLSNASVNLLGVLNVGSLVSALAPLVNAVGTMLTGSLLPALGVTTDGVDLWAQPTPTCRGPKLVG